VVLTVSSVLSKLEAKLEQRIRRRLEQEAQPLIAEMQLLREELVKLNRNIIKLIRVMEGQERGN